MKLDVLISGAFSATLDHLTPEYESETGNILASTLAASMGDSPTTIPHRLDRGESPDVIVMVEPDLRRLEAACMVVRGSVVELAVATLGLAVRAGAPQPDIGSTAAVAQTLRRTSSIAVSESASGVYLRTTLLARLGIEDEVAPRVMTVSHGLPGEAVARGDAEIAFEQLSELLPVRGLAVVGELPACLQQVTRVAAGVAWASSYADAARDLVAFLAAPRHGPTLKRHGLRTPLRDGWREKPATNWGSGG